MNDILQPAVSGMAPPALPDCSALGRVITFKAMTAEVLSIDRWTDTFLSTAPGSVHVVGSGMVVHPPRVWASTFGRQAVWLRMADREVRVAVPADLAIRAGQTVQAIVAREAAGADAQWAAIVNHGTGTWTQIDHYPPGGRFGFCTKVLQLVGGLVGVPGAGILIVYISLWLIVCLCLFTGSGFIGNFFMATVAGIMTGFGHMMLALPISAVRSHQYAAGVRRACEATFATAPTSNSKVSQAA